MEATRYATDAFSSCNRHGSDGVRRRGKGDHWVGLIEALIESIDDLLVFSEGSTRSLQAFALLIPGKMRNMLRQRPILSNYMKCALGDGKSAFLWYDCWSDLGDIIMDGDDAEDKEMDATQEPEGVITRSRAKELARDAHAMMLKEELGASSTSMLMHRKRTKL
ncbi:unnamed protein product [Cochlearia groenlandica]